jgi:catechol 2,3-dioxygenase
MTTSPLYPAVLDHVQVTSADPGRLADYYARILGGRSETLAGGQRLIDGAERRLIFAEGPSNKFGYSAFALGSVDRVKALGAHLRSAGLPLLPSPSALFGNEAFAVADPDGNRLVFGAGPSSRVASPKADAIAGRLQHAVVATTDVAAMMAFYGDKLGFRLSDRVRDDKGEITAVFYRSDDEHHSFACFRAPAARLDHFCFETTSWNDIRDWADHMAAQRLSLGWGPGRHGPGNNLFFMLNDPDGNAYEFSAELERMPPEMATRDWQHEPRTLNLWGVAWMRS